MYTPVYTKQFQKDVKRCQRRGKDFDKFKVVVRALLSGKTLSAQYRDHKLSGKLAGHCDCHIEPDWVLIYRVDGSRIIFERLGTHSDLFE